MSERATQTLRAMLLGEPPYERYGAPEPGVLLELVPVLPEDVLREAVWDVSYLGFIWPSERLRLLAALLERAVGAGQATSLAEVIVYASDVVPYLAKSILPQILDAVRAFEGWDEPGKATVLALLSARAPEPSLQDVLAAARVPIDYGHHQRAQALATAISGLPKPLAESALSDLLDAARAMKRGNDRGAVLAGLLSHLEESERQAVGLEALAAFQSDDERGPERAGALAALSGQLPEPLRSQVLDQALAEARALEYGDAPARALIEVSQWVDEPLASELLREIQASDLSDMELIPLAPYLSEAQLEHALHVLSPGFPSEMLGGALADLAPYLPERLLAEALRQGEEEARSLAAIQALAPHLSPPLLSEALDLALSLQGRWARGRALAALWPYLDGEQRSVAGSGDELLSGEYIRWLWARLSDEEQVSLAQDAIHAVVAYYGGAPPQESIGGVVEPTEPARPREPADREVGAEKGLKPKGLPTGERLVNTGFSTPARAGLPLEPSQLLVPGRTYYFWFQVGRRVAGAIDVADVALPVEHLPTEARLTLALYSFEGELRLTPGRDVGEIQVQSDLSVRVVRPVEPGGAPETLRPEDPLHAERCLFFPIATPGESGLHRLRCNIYYEGILVQSHLVQAAVMESGVRSAVDQPAEGAPALTARCDYTLSNTLRPEALTRLEPHRLSLMINDNGDGTHGFRFFGRDEVQATDPRELKYDSKFDGPQLQHLIDLTRGALRAVTWGDEEPWDWRKMYRYGLSVRPGRLNRDRIEQLKGDLVHLARRGYTFYVDLIGELAAGDETSRRVIRERRKELEGLMARPGGLIQIASKQSARHVVPLAMVYDYGLDPGALDGTFSVCPEFLAALEARKPLGETACFQGACPSRGDLTVVCPSGFWGYRHGIGMPVSIGGTLQDAVAEIVYRGAPQLTVAVSTDERLRLRAEHEQALRALRDDVGWHYADTRDEALDLMEATPSHVVYFYCHGGVTEDDLPYIEVGGPDQGRITSGLLFAKDVFWEGPQPLVFINGCHTTALEPEVAYDLVRTFVETVGAAGVIGTQITVYESLAVPFAEACLTHFFSGTAIGEAVRRARLELLQQGNPLGLVYDAFAVASLKMVPQS